MSSLYRTARPRFTLYSPDGLGRDRYIIYNNGGFWKTNEYKISPKPNYEYPKYNNFHTLFHMAAPFKYYSDGSGRDSYVLRDTGLRREQKPLNSYHLSDFLRNDSWDKHSRKNVFLSRAEIRDNKLPNPKEIGTAWSFFANPIITTSEFSSLIEKLPQLKSYPCEDVEKVKLSAGQLIDLAGMKGFQLWDAWVSEKHALILIHKEWNAENLLKVAELVQEKVFKMFNVKLIPEVVYVS